MNKAVNRIKLIFSGLVKDIWVVLLDIIAVNAAYYLALMIRYFVNFSINPSATQHVEDFFHFAPWYTICCIIVFAFFKLYNNLWKYVGMGDLNRILAASAVTCVVQVLGTVLLIRRMPLSYYVIGAALQAFFIIIIRFSYRFITVERTRARKWNKPAVNAMVIGVGGIGRRVVKHLEENTAYRALCLVDVTHTARGRSLNGIPIISEVEEIEEAIRNYQIKAVFLASIMIPDETRTTICDLCEKNQLELQDYTGFLSNLTGTVSLTGLLEVIQGSVTIIKKGVTKKYNNGEDAISDLRQQYQVKAISAISGEVIIELQDVTPGATTIDDIWMREYKEETGEEVSFF